MGVAAYNRGSRLISLQHQREAYARGLSPFDPDAPAPKPTPRAADWGSKSRAKALERARGILRGLRKYDLPVDLETLAGAVELRERCSGATARAAAEQALSEEASLRRNPRKMTFDESFRIYEEAADRAYRTYQQDHDATTYRRRIAAADRARDKRERAIVASRGGRS